MQRSFQFYIVPTPIGNMGDITYRAIEVLNSVDLVACEDTRTTQKLLNHYNIKTKTFAYHKFNEKSKVDEILSLLNSGKTIALVSDAGTPMICDPGSILISELIKNNVSITSLAGASALTTFLSQVPRKNEFFTFIGFFPQTRQQREQILTDYSKSNLVFYESPNRIIETLKFVKDVVGNVNIALSRELTKLYEETIIDSIDNVIEHFNDEVKGEIVCMIYPKEQNDDVDIQSKIKVLQKEGFKSKEISVILSVLYDLNKNQIYKTIVNSEK